MFQGTSGPQARLLASGHACRRPLRVRIMTPLRCASNWTLVAASSRSMKGDFHACVSLCLTSLFFLTVGEPQVSLIDERWGPARAAPELGPCRTLLGVDMQAYNVCKYSTMHLANRNPSFVEHQTACQDQARISPDRIVAATHDAHGRVVGELGAMSPAPAPRASNAYLETHRTCLQKR